MNIKSRNFGFWKGIFGSLHGNIFLHTHFGFVGDRHFVEVCVYFYNLQ